MSARAWVLGLWLGGISTAQAQPPALAGVEVQARRQAGEAPPELTTARVTTRAGDRLERLLAARGIYADGEAIGLVYTLNPDFTGGVLTPGRKLVLPVAQQRGAECAPACLVAVTRDRPQKQLLHATSDSLAAQAPQVAGLADARFTDAALHRRVSDQVAAIASQVRAIDVAVGERARPLSPEMVRQTVGDAVLARGLIDRLVRGDARITAASIAPLDAAAANLAIRAGRLDEKMGDETQERWADIEVTVRTVGSAARLRVYYATELQFFVGDEAGFSSFDQLTSPSTRPLPEGNYRLWAGDPGQPSVARARTDVIRLELLRRHGAPATRSVELLVK